MLIRKINNPNFNRLWNNKILLKSLEKISEHGTSFSAGISLAMALGVRPLAIMSTPDVEKENKQYACANSIASGIMKFAIVEAVALPVENAVKKIDKNPEKYLKPFTVKNLAHSSGKLAESKSYKLAAQILKLGTGFITAVPKSMLTIALIPIIMDKLFNFKPKKSESAAPQKKSPTFPKPGILFYTVKTIFYATSFDRSPISFARSTSCFRMAKRLFFSFSSSAITITSLKKASISGRKPPIKFKAPA